MRRGWRIAARAATVLVAGLLTLTGAQLALAAAAPPEGAAGAAVPALVPAPVSLRAVPGEAFRLTARARIVARAAAAGPVADYLAGVLRRPTGFRLPVTREQPPEDGSAIVLDLGGPESLGREGYGLDAGEEGVTLRARTPEGLFRGVQTLRQLLPARIESDAPQPGPWTVPGVRIVDQPRFAWRGAMLDVSRHFFGVAQVERYIDLISRYKLNVFHLHLSDDQGWRIAIDGWPRLTAVGGSTAVGGGPGGFYTQGDYAAIVRYAAARYITVVPEIDTPGHVNAALASYAQLNCDGQAPPLYTGTDVGFSSLCVGKPVTYRFLDDVLGQLAALTPGPYLHVGGDEADSTSPQDYLAFIGRVQQIVHAHGKRLLGWEQVAGAPLARTSVAQFWTPASGSDPAADNARLAVRQGVKVVMSPANRVYLDMKYTEATPLGQDWAGLIEVRDSYSWDPATLVDGVTERDVLGVEAPLWSETLVTPADVEYMTFPRLPSVAEIDWSPQSGRSWESFRLRLAAQGPRWDAEGVHFYRSPQVPWPAPAADAAA
jgi:hexosaminidase